MDNQRSTNNTKYPKKKKNNKTYLKLNATINETNLTEVI